MRNKSITKTLKAKQIMTFIHPDGVGTGLMMIDDNGLIFIKVEDGWEPFDMRRAPRDSKI